MDNVSDVEEKSGHEYPVRYESTEEGEQRDDYSKQRKTTAQKVLDRISEI